MYHHDGQRIKGDPEKARPFAARVCCADKNQPGECDPHGIRESGDHAVNGAIDRTRGQGDPK